MADLITVAEYKDAEGLRGEKDDDRLQVIVPQVSDLVKKYCGTSIGNCLYWGIVTWRFFHSYICSLDYSHWANLRRT